MKKILYAWIEQILEFDNDAEYLVFLEELKQKGQKFRIKDQRNLKSGKVRVNVMKNYNRNHFPKE